MQRYTDWVGVGDWVGVAVVVHVGCGVGVAVLQGETGRVQPEVGVATTVGVPVDTAVTIGMDVEVAVGAIVGVAVGAVVGVAVGAVVGVGAMVQVAVGEVVGVAVGVVVGVAVIATATDVGTLVGVAVQMRTSGATAKAVGVNTESPTDSDPTIYNTRRSDVIWPLAWTINRVADCPSNRPTFSVNTKFRRATASFDCTAERV